MDLQQQYKKEVLPELQKELGYNNPLSVPRLEKIVVNVGLGEALTNKKVLDTVGEQLTAVAGQKPLPTKAKRAISGFKLRAGREIGLKVTLRRKRMYDFLTKVSRVVLPRLRDFRGVDPGKFDKQGNISLGFDDITVFPEMDIKVVSGTQSMEATFVTNTKKDSEAKLLLEKLGIPFSTKEHK